MQSKVQFSNPLDLIYLMIIIPSDESDLSVEGFG